MSFGNESLAWREQRPGHDTAAPRRHVEVVVTHMPHASRSIGARRAARNCIAALVTCLLLPAASWAAGPNFDAVSWLPLGCDAH